jgi:hypothetical protein
MLLWSCVAGNNAIVLKVAARLARSSHLNVRHLFSTIWCVLKIKDGI